MTLHTGYEWDDLAEAVLTHDPEHEHRAWDPDTCISCSVETDSTVTGRIGDQTGPLCSDCAVWCDGNVIT